MTWSSIQNAADNKVLHLTTLGRRTRLPRKIEIWLVVHNDRFYLFVEASEAAAWVKNIRRNPAVTVRIGEPRIGATARVLDREVDRELWDQVAAIADRKYGWGDGLPVEITPIVPRTADPVTTVNPSDGPCAAVRRPHEALRYLPHGSEHRWPDVDRPVASGGRRAPALFRTVARSTERRFLAYRARQRSRIRQTGCVPEPHRPALPETALARMKRQRSPAAKQRDAGMRSGLAALSGSERLSSAS
jgi:deazaflavin-dependent oxidoreductase (nitroreductase family)